MAKPPVLRDWKGLVEDQMGTAGYKEDDILKMAYACEDYIAEIQPAIKWVNVQNSFLQQILGNFRDQYALRFGKEIPPRPTEMLVSEVPLDTPERRKQAVREVALAMTKPGDNISDEAILEELKHRGMKLIADNPTATISTILHGFKPQFSKIEGKRGVFKRQE
jgi:hypothetical protein